MISSIKIYNIKIQEPAATIADIAVTAVCFYAFAKLSKLKSENLSIKHFNMFFLTMGFATLFGGLIGHAFIYALDFTWKLPGWLLSMVSISFLVHGALLIIEEEFSELLIKTVKTVNISLLIFFSSLTIFNLDFFYTTVHSTFSFIILILPLQLLIYLKTKNQFNFLILAGIVTTAIAAYFFNYKISYNQWIDYLTISHSIIAFSTYIFYLAFISFLQTKKLSAKEETIPEIIL